MKPAAPSPPGYRGVGKVIIFALKANVNLASRRFNPHYR